jgi:hypothetical protein
MLSKRLVLEDFFTTFFAALLSVASLTFMLKLLITLEFTLSIDTVAAALALAATRCGRSEKKINFKS